MNTIMTHVTFEQEPDCCSKEEMQSLSVEIVSGGGGHYAIISTERWAMDLDDFDRLRATITELVHAADLARGETPDDQRIQDETH